MRGFGSAFLHVSKSYMSRRAGRLAIPLCELWHVGCFAERFILQMMLGRNQMTVLRRARNQDGGIGYVLLWLVGLPLPLVLVLYLLFH